MPETLRGRVARVALACILALSCFSVSSISALVSAHEGRTEAYAADTWKKSGGRWWYQTGDTYAKGWKKIGGKWYYFDSKGWMQTGWKKISGSWYYLGSDGAMKTGWQKVNGSWYYLYPSGEMAKSGWHSIDGKSYYLKDDGVLNTGWNPYGLFTYMYHSSAGVMATGWQKIGGKWYYFNNDGLMLSGWQYISGKWYYLESSGAMVANKWVDNYYFKSDGSMATNQKIGKYYVGSNGRWTGAPAPTSAQKNAIVGEWHIGAMIIGGVIAAMPGITIPHSDFCFQAFSDGTYQLYWGKETGWKYGTWEFRDIRNDEWDKSIQYFDYVLFESGKPYAEVTASSGSVLDDLSLSPLGTVSCYTLIRA